MKNKILIVLLISQLLLLAGCKKTAADDAGMIKIAREVISVADAETVDIQIIGTIGTDAGRLVCFMTGNQYQGHSYIPIEFDTAGQEKYEFVKVYKTMDRGRDIRAVMWNKGYVFIVNNDVCKSIGITSENGTVESVEVSQTPFVYYYEGIPAEYQFLDSSGSIMD